jgi:hypothetical protein
MRYGLYRIAAKAQSYCDEASIATPQGLYRESIVQKRRKRKDSKALKTSFRPIPFSILLLARRFFVE